MTEMDQSMTDSISNHISKQYVDLDHSTSVGRTTSCETLNQQSSTFIKKDPTSDQLEPEAQIQDAKLNLGETIYSCLVQSPMQITDDTDSRFPSPTQNLFTMLKFEKEETKTNMSGSSQEQQQRRMTSDEMQDIQNTDLVTRPASDARAIGYFGQKDQQSQFYNEQFTTVQYNQGQNYSCQNFISNQYDQINQIEYFASQPYNQNYAPHQNHQFQYQQAQYPIQQKEDYNKLQYGQQQQHVQQYQFQQYNTPHYNGTNSARHQTDQDYQNYQEIYNYYNVKQYDQNFQNFNQYQTQQYQSDPQYQNVPQYHEMTQQNFQYQSMQPEYYYEVQHTVTGNLKFNGQVEIAAINHHILNELVCEDPLLQNHATRQVAGSMTLDYRPLTGPLFKNYQIDEGIFVYYPTLKEKSDIKEEDCISQNFPPSIVDPGMNNGIEVDEILSNNHCLRRRVRLYFEILKEEGGTKDNTLVIKPDVWKQLTDVSAYPDHWCKITYYEKHKPLGSVFKTNSTKIYVSGADQPNRPDRFSFGPLTKLNRESNASEVLSSAGGGITILCSRSTVSIYSDCKSSVFFASTFNDSRGKVMKLSTGQSAQLFNYNEFYDRLISSPKRYEDVLRFSDECTFMISFVKGWGSMYKRKKITDVPCWIELDLVDPRLPVSQILEKLKPIGGCTSRS